MIFNNKLIINELRYLLIYYIYYKKIYNKAINKDLMWITTKCLYSVPHIPEPNELPELVLDEPGAMPIIFCKSATMPKIDEITNIATTPHIIMSLLFSLAVGFPAWRIKFAIPQKKNKIQRAKAIGMASFTSLPNATKRPLIPPRGSAKEIRGINTKDKVIIFFIFFKLLKLLW